MQQVILTPIGIVRSPFTEPRGTPIQAAGVPVGAGRGRVEIVEEFREGLQDLEGFSHVILIYYCHRTRDWTALVEPFLDDQAHGVFATRAPSRPNPLGLSVVRLLGIEDGVLSVEGLDLVDGTPLLDLKPYVPQFDCVDAERIGWLQGRIEGMGRARDDGRFLDGDRDGR
jgi:tRNA-Thr(GGU) m(6)t(6)A37 methyltransferase TsaA